MKYIKYTAFRSACGYFHANCAKEEQLAVTQIAKRAGMSYLTCLKIRDFLAELKFIQVVDGSKKIYWNKEYSNLTESMANHLYKLYISKAGEHVQKERGSISLEEALRVIANHGYSGILSKKRVEGVVTIIEQLEI